MTIRKFLVCAGITAALIAVPSLAAATPLQSSEVSGGSSAARAAVTMLKDPFDTAVGSAPAPIVISGSVGAPLSGAIGTTPDGVTVSVERARYDTVDPFNPAFVGYSTNPGIGTCGGSGTNMQGSAPRPDVLTGLPDCSDSGMVYNEVSGAGESTTRDAVELTFSRPVIAFGAWFGDLETRTDGQGTPAIVYLYGTDGTTLVEQYTVVPDAADQSVCGNTSRQCGNGSTRWLGFYDRLVSRMVVVVGDEDAGGDGTTEGMSFVGPTPVSPTLGITATLDASGVVVEVGDEVLIPFTVTNTSQVEVALDAICDVSSLPVGGTTTCYVPHTVTEEDAVAGGFNVSLSPTGSWYDLSATDTTSGFIPLTLRTTPSSPAYAPSNECDVEPEVTIPGTSGVTYSEERNGDTLTVSASANPGYVFPAGATTVWSFDMSVEACPAPTPAPTSDQLATTGSDGPPHLSMALVGACVLAGIGLIALGRQTRRVC